MAKVRILYIEDDDIQRKTLASGLRSKGHSVSVATSGRTGLRLFNSKAFEVILCDLNMPEMDGLGVLENIRRKDPDIPFIILSAHGTVPLALKAIKKGATYFVLKPVEINQITITIEQIIEKTKLQKKMQDSQNILQMVAGIAHEINTPIGAVSSMYDTLSRTLRNLQGVLESKFPTEYEQLPELKSTFKIIQDSNHVIKSGTERVTTKERGQST